MENENKNNLISNSNSINKKELKVKLTKLSKDYINPRCEHFVNNLRSLNFRILESSGGKKSIDKEVKLSRNFHFGKSKDYFAHFTDLAPFQIEFNPFIKNLKKQFTKDEINIIKKNKDYYIQNETIKNNISLFNDRYLYQVLNFEEKEEKKKKEKKIFHNQNYFNKRRKSIILDFYNNINASGNNSLNQSEKVLNNIIPFYKTGIKDTNIKSSKSVEKENKLTYNLENLSHENVIKNKLNVIEKEIRKGVREMKKEDEKSNSINENRKKILFDMEKQTQQEIKKLFDEKNNFKHNVSYEIKSIKNRNFPRININNTISNSQISHINISNSNKIVNLNTYYLFNKEKEKEYKNQIRLYKKMELDRRKGLRKLEEKENLLIKNLHKRIKSIYDNIKFNK
jgi:hypothetical protein